MHKIPFLWAFHQVHHSAEVITPLTHHRIHPFESWLYDMRGALVTGVVAGGFYWLFRGAVSDYTLLGVPALGFVCNVTTGNLRHSHVWLRFPSAVERWLISPAQHQLHHSLEPVHHGSNYGTWLAIWDRVFGVLIVSDKAPASFGIPVSERNHGDDLLSAWFGPMRGAFLPLLVLFLLTAGGIARAQELSAGDLVEEEKSSDEDWSGFGEEIFVDGDQEGPREAGSAYIVDEEALAIFEYDDIERVLATVPGVSTRGEDGYGLRPNIGIRGANSDRSAKITLMEDGILLAPAPYAAPAAYYFPMSTRFVGVEVFKGAAATRYGPQTVGGAINVLTRSIPKETEAYSDLSIGMRHSYKAHAWSGSTHKRVGFLVEGVHLRSGGFKELDSGGSTGFARTEFMVKGDIKPGSPVHRLRLKLGYANETSHETYLGLSQSDWESTPLRRYAATEKALMEWDRTQAVLEWLVRPNPYFKLRTVAYHHYLNRSWTKLNGFSDSMGLHELLQVDPDSGQGAVYLAILRGEEDSSGDGQNLLIGTNDRQFQSFGVQSTLRWESFGERLGSSFEAGLRLHGDDVKRLHTEEPFAMFGGRLIATDLSTETLLDSHAGVLALAGYVHEDLSLGRVHLFPSGRVEVVRGWREDEGEEPSPVVTRPALLPGFGGLYELNDWADAFLSAHRGFSPVSPGQSQEVKPEYSWNYEAGLRHNLGGYRAELVGYFNDYQNLTGECTMSSGCDSDNLGRQYNGGRVSIYGLESVGGVKIPLSPGVSAPIDATYTLTESQFQTDFLSGFSQFGSVQQGDRLPYVARHSASLRAGLETNRLTLKRRGELSKPAVGFCWLFYGC